jgi:S-disulfanyl-L-cysteine oxidoreductase SoxD
MKPAICIFVLTCLASLCGQPPASVWDGVYSEEQAGRGKPMYARECATCHGSSLSGGEEAPSLTGSAFMANWSGLSVGDLFERIRLSMPEGRPGTLSRQENADILAYILSVNQFPTGKTELQKDTDRLRQIRFLAEKPEPGK